MGRIPGFQWVYFGFREGLIWSYSQDVRQGGSHLNVWVGLGDALLIWVTHMADSRRPQSLTTWSSPWHCVVSSQEGDWLPQSELSKREPSRNHNVFSDVVVKITCNHFREILPVTQVGSSHCGRGPHKAGPPGSQDHCRPSWKLATP